MCCSYSKNRDLFLDTIMFLKRFSPLFVIIGLGVRCDRILDRLDDNPKKNLGIPYLVSVLLSLNSKTSFVNSVEKNYLNLSKRRKYALCLRRHIPVFMSAWRNVGWENIPFQRAIMKLRQSDSRRQPHLCVPHKYFIYKTLQRKNHNINTAFIFSTFHYPREIVVQVFKSDIQSTSNIIHMILYIS